MAPLDRQTGSVGARGLTVHGTQPTTIRVGTRANRPTVGFAGRIYIANDDGLQWIDNGTNWVPIGGQVDFSQAPLEISNNGVDADHDIDIAAGTCRMTHATAPDETAVSASTIVKQIDATWAEGSAAGGLNDTDFAAGTGGPEADTWYGVFGLMKADGTVDGGFDKLGTGANLIADAVASAAGYAWFRRLGWVKTNGSENIYQFIQDGDRFDWKDPDGNGFDYSDDGVDLTASGTGPLEVITGGATGHFVPVGPGITGHFRVQIEAATASGYLLLYQTDLTAQTPGSGDDALATIGGAPSNDEVSIRMPSSNGINAIVIGDTSINVDILTLGWSDSRGRTDGA